MVQINLVPEKVRAADTLRVVVLLGSLALLLPLGFWGWRFVALNTKLASVDAEIIELQKELDKPELVKIVKLVDQFAKNESDLKVKLSLVEILRARQIVLLRVLDLVPDAMQPQAWLSKIEMKEDMGAKKALFEGFAISPEVMATIFSALENHPVVKGLKMVQSPKVRLQREREAVEYKFSFNIEEGL